MYKAFAFYKNILSMFPKVLYRSFYRNLKTNNILLQIKNMKIFSNHQVKTRLLKNMMFLTKKLISLRNQQSVRRDAFFVCIKIRSSMADDFFSQSGSAMADPTMVAQK